MSSSKLGSIISEEIPVEKVEESETTNVKETIESILVAFILAFIFRAFVVEAFVIPTGSMATTLLGAHMRFTCPDCGYVFDVNYQVQGQENNDDPQIPSEGHPADNVYCPNCGYAVASRADPLPVQYGDRILVLKYIYLLHPPKRWDVVVFKSPDDPATSHYTVNFIKRLVGKPGERLMILDGDLYIAPPDDPSHWVIQTKPADVQEAMWRIIYDNDFYPQNLNRVGLQPWRQPWKVVAGAGWNLGSSAADGRAFHFNNLQSGGEIAFDPSADSTTQTVSNYLAYNNNSDFRRPGSIVGSSDDEQSFPVSDLKLVADYHRNTGDGPLKLILRRHESVDHTFTAEITPDSVRLLHQSGTTVAQIGQTLKLADLGIRGNAPIFAEFMNVDYKITLRLNGRTVLESTPADYAPNIEWLLRTWREHGELGEALIEADNQTCDLEHLSLWRDVYYTNRARGGESLHWGSPDSPVQLRANEYFVMGDNSSISQDARYWSQPIKLPHEDLDIESGRVPSQFMLGQAVFVYWPAGYRAFDTHLSIIPDFGDMRWIH